MYVIQPVLIFPKRRKIPLISVLNIYILGRFGPFVSEIRLTICAQRMLRWELLVGVKLTSLEGPSRASPGGTPTLSTWRVVE